jgi:hypothetical protein
MTVFVALMFNHQGVVASAGAYRKPGSVMQARHYRYRQGIIELNAFTETLDWLLLQTFTAADGVATIMPCIISAV